MVKNLPGEVWKDINGYEGLYKVSNKGRVFNILKNNFLLDNHRGNIILKDNKNKRRMFSLNKILYQLFIDNNNTMNVYAKDGNIHNHDVSNLTLCRTEKYINTIINNKYKIIDITYNNTLKKYLFTIECMQCHKMVKLNTSISSVKKRKYFKCNCWNKYNIGDIILNKYKIINKQHTPRKSKDKIENHYNYTLECSECHDTFTVTSLNIRPNKKKVSFNCSCYKNRVYRVSSVYNGLKILDKISKASYYKNNKYIHGSERYKVMCIHCGTVKTIEANNFTKHYGIKCRCNTPKKHNVGDIVLDKYRVVKIKNNTGHGTYYDLVCLKCNTKLYNRRALEDTSKDSYVKEYGCKCKFPEKNIGDILFNKYKIIDRIPTKKPGSYNYIVKCLICNKIPEGKPRPLSRMQENLKCGCFKDFVYKVPTDKLIKIIHKSMISRCNVPRTSYSKIYVIKYWHNSINFMEWYKNAFSKYDYTNFNLPSNLLKRHYKATVDRIDPRYEYAPYNCQLIPWHINCVSKKYNDAYRSKFQLKLDELAFKRRKRNWLKEMKKQGYTEEELI